MDITIIDPACAERGCACHDPRIDGPGVKMVPETDVQQERLRCAKLVENVIRRNKGNVALRDKLQDLLLKIRNPARSTGARGGLLTEQLELPFGN